MNSDKTMDYLISKTKGKDGGYYMVLSNTTIFDKISKFDNTRNYDDEYKLKDDEWFVVENFSKKEYCISLLKEDFVSALYSNINKDNYNKIDFIVAIQDDNYYLFQKITPSLLYSRKSFISLFSEQPRLLKGEFILVIKENPDCIYVKDIDKLYFKNLNTITSIFNGINELYREATDKEVEDFLNMEIISLGANFNKDQVKTANRRRIKEAIEKYYSFSDIQKLMIPTYINKYCPNLYNSSINKFSISCEKELTELLNTFNQRYYTTEIDSEKRLANSITKL